MLLCFAALPPALHTEAHKLQQAFATIPATAFVPEPPVTCTYAHDQYSSHSGQELLVRNRGGTSTSSFNAYAQVLELMSRDIGSMTHITCSVARGKWAHILECLRLTPGQREAVMGARKEHLNKLRAVCQERQDLNLAVRPVFSHLLCLLCAVSSVCCKCQSFHQCNEPLNKLRAACQEQQDLN